MDFEIVLNMDPGIDGDAALIMALGSVDIKILGISIVSGNVHVDRGLSMHSVLSYLGKRIGVLISRC